MFQTSGTLYLGACSMTNVDLPKKPVINAILNMSNDLRDISQDLATNKTYTYRRTGGGLFDLCLPGPGEDIRIKRCPTCHHCKIT